jgi:hypothetical protein
LEQARLATLALTRATAATAHEPMLVPGLIADALGRLLVIYLIAVEVASADYIYLAPLAPAVECTWGHSGLGFSCRRRCSLSRTG